MLRFIGVRKMELSNSQIASMKRRLLKQNPRDFCLFSFGLYSGLRPTHLINLNISDVLDENGYPRETIKVKHRNDYLTLTLSKPAKAFIRKYYQLFLKDNFNYNQPLFPSRKGGEAISRSQAHRVLRSASRAVGIEFNFSTFALVVNFILKRCWLDRNHPDLNYPFDSEELEKKLPEELLKYYKDFIY